jgi:hypothetical protein
MIFFPDCGPVFAVGTGREMIGQALSQTFFEGDYNVF